MGWRHLSRDLYEKTSALSPLRRYLIFFMAQESSISSTVASVIPTSTSRPLFTGVPIRLSTASFYTTTITTPLITGAPSPPLTTRFSDAPWCHSRWFNRPESDNPYVGPNLYDRPEYYDFFGVTTLEGPDSAWTECAPYGVVAPVTYSPGVCPEDSAIAGLSVSVRGSDTDYVGVCCRRYSRTQSLSSLA